MPSRDPKQRLHAILDNIDAARSFVADPSFERFAGDLKTVYAVGRALEIISEASRRLPDEIRRRHPEIDWRALAGLGNVYRHDYDVVDARLMWLTTSVDCPRSKQSLRRNSTSSNNDPNRGRPEEGT